MTLAVVFAGLWLWELAKRVRAERVIDQIRGNVDRLNAEIEGKLAETAARVPYPESFDVLGGDETRGA